MPSKGGLFHQAQYSAVLESIADQGRKKLDLEETRKEKK